MKYLVIFLTVLTSCQFEVDNSDIFKVGEALHESFISNDTLILKRVFAHNMDRISKSQKESLTEIQKFYNKDLAVLKVDTSSYESWVGNIKLLDMYYKKSSSFYRIRAYYQKDSLGNNYIDELYFNDINKLCEEDKNKPYCPINLIEFKGINWTTDNDMTFKSGAIVMQNNSEFDLNYVKFRVILKSGYSSWSAKTFLNQTVESDKLIYKGDLATVDIPGMQDYFTGFKIERDNLFFNAELIEILPKPESTWCKLLEDLQKASNRE